MAGGQGLPAGCGQNGRVVCLLGCQLMAEDTLCRLAWLRIQFEGWPFYLEVGLMAGIPYRPIQGPGRAGLPKIALHKCERPNA